MKLQFLSRAFGNKRYARRCVLGLFLFVIFVNNILTTAATIVIMMIQNYLCALELKKVQCYAGNMLWQTC